MDVPISRINKSTATTIAITTMRIQSLIVYIGEESSIVIKKTRTTCRVLKVCDIFGKVIFDVYDFVINYHEYNHFKYLYY